MELANRMKMSKELAQWAPGLVEVMKLVVKRMASESPKVRVLSAKEKEAMKSWQAHMDMNHLPYCRDCGERRKHEQGQAQKAHQGTRTLHSIP